MAAAARPIYEGEAYNNNQTENRNNRHIEENSEQSEASETEEENRSNFSGSLSNHLKKKVRIEEQYYCLAMDELRPYEHFLAQLLLATLKRVGVCVLNNFLPETLAESVRDEVEGLYNRPDTKRTKGDMRYRTDEVAWIGTQDLKNKSVQKLSHALQKLVASMRHLNELKPHRFKITHQSHLQVSRFPKASKLGYKPHIENPNNNGRLLSATYFTNKGYSQIPDEGQVRFYLEKNTKYVEVEPNFNTAVIYWSDRRLIKEVLPSNAKDLFHITTWFFGSCAIP